MTIRRHDRDRYRMIEQQQRFGDLTNAEAEELLATQLRKVYGGARLIK